MKIQQNRKGTGQFLFAAVVAAALTGCAASRQQPSAENTSANALATPAAQATPQAARARPAATRRAPSAEASSKSSSAVILAQIHQADLKEIAIGKIADEKASTSEVRDYADQLVKDHTTVDQTVVATARTMNVHLHDAAAPREGRHERAHASITEQKLNSASGATFDRLFLQQTSADHDKLIRALKQEREDASDETIEALIDKILPIFEQQRELAQMLLKKEQA
jgi:predicted outer membrane protein